jgi:hypothetical protein
LLLITAPAASGFDGLSSTSEDTEEEEECSRNNHHIVGCLSIGQQSVRYDRIAMNRVLLRGQKSRQIWASSRCRFMLLIRRFIVAASTFQASTQAFVPRRQYLLHSMALSSAKEGVLTNDIISHNVVNHDDDEDDARAYHELVSAAHAVDYTHIYERNGIVTAIRTTRDIDTNSRRSFLYNIPLLRSSSTPPPSSLMMLSSPIEVPTKIKARVPSPSGFKIAILVEENLPSSSSTTTTGLVD